MKLVFAFVLALLLPLAACDEAPDFHPPQTEAEKALDKVFRTYDADNAFHGYIFGYSHNHDKDKEFSRLVSKSFVEKSTKKEQALIIESCGGKVPADGLPCDMTMDVNLIFCSQDSPDTFLYRTIRSNNREAIITYAWPVDTAEGGPTYRFINDGGHWLLDATSCAEYPEPVE